MANAIAFAVIARVLDQTHHPASFAVMPDEVRCIVARAIVDDDHLGVPVLLADKIHHPIEGRTQTCALVISGNNNADAARSIQRRFSILSVHCPTENADPGRTDLAGPPHPHCLEIEASEEVAAEPALDRPPIWQKGRRRGEAYLQEIP